jgi:hypothetical protein
VSGSPDALNLVFIHNDATRRDESKTVEMMI